MSSSSSASPFAAAASVASGDANTSPPSASATPPMTGASAGTQVPHHLPSTAPTAAGQVAAAAAAAAASALPAEDVPPNSTHTSALSAQEAGAQGALRADVGERSGRNLSGVSAACTPFQDAVEEQQPIVDAPLPQGSQQPSAQLSAQETTQQLSAQAQLSAQETTQQLSAQAQLSSQAPEQSAFQDAVEQLTEQATEPQQEPQGTQKQQELPQAGQEGGCKGVVILLHGHGCVHVCVCVGVGGWVGGCGGLLHRLRAVWGGSIFVVSSISAAGVRCNAVGLRIVNKR